MPPLSPPLPVLPSETPETANAEVTEQGALDLASSCNGLVRPGTAARSRIRLLCSGSNPCMPPCNPSLVLHVVNLLRRELLVHVWNTTLYVVVVQDFRVPVFKSE